MSLGDGSKKGGAAPAPSLTCPDAGPQGPIGSGTGRRATQSPARFYHWHWWPKIGYAIPFAGVQPAPGMVPAVEGTVRGPWGWRGPQRTVNCSCLWEGQAALESLRADGRLSYFFFPLNIHKKCHHLLS